LRPKKNLIGKEKTHSSHHLSRFDITSFHSTKQKKETHLQLIQTKGTKRKEKGIGKKILNLSIL
jgi:hypothetical protein